MVKFNHLAALGFLLESVEPLYANGGGYFHGPLYER